MKSWFFPSFILHGEFSECFPCSLHLISSQRYESWKRSAVARVNSLACCPKSWRSFACRPQKWTWPAPASSTIPASLFWPTEWASLQNEVSCSALLLILYWRYRMIWTVSFFLFFFINIFILRTSWKKQPTLVHVWHDNISVETELYVFKNRVMPAIIFKWQLHLS